MFISPEPPARVQRQRRSPSLPDLYHDANMFLPGRRTGTIDLDADSGYYEDAPTFDPTPAQQQQQQGYTTPGRGWQQVPLFDAEPPAADPAPAVPAAMQLPMTARYTVNDNDVFVYASCDIRDSPKYRRARLLEAAAAASPSQPAAAAPAPPSTHSSSRTLTAAALAAAAAPQAGSAAPASTATAAAGDAATSTTAEQVAGQERTGTTAGAAGAGIWAQLLMEPSAPVASPRRSAVDAVPEAPGPIGVWAEMLRRPSTAAAPVSAAATARGAADDDAVASASAAAATAGGASREAVTTAEPPAAAVDAVAEDAESGIAAAAGLPASAEQRSDGVRAADQTRPASRATPTATAVPPPQHTAQRTAPRAGSADTASDDGFGAAAAAPAVPAVERVSGAAAAPAPAESVYDSEDMDGDAAVGVLGSSVLADSVQPAEAPTPTPQRDRGSSTAGLPRVALYAGVGAAGSALFFDPDRDAAGASGQAQLVGEAPQQRQAALRAAQRADHVPGPRQEERVAFMPALQDDTQPEAVFRDMQPDVGVAYPRREETAAFTQQADAVEGDWRGGAGTLRREAAGPLFVPAEYGQDESGVWLRDGVASVAAGAPRGRAEATPAVVPPAVEETAIVLAAPSFEAPDVAQGGYLSTETRPSWQLRLPPQARRLVWLANQCQDIWATVFPEKPPEQKELEAKVRQAVMRGDLHWSVLNDVKQGRRIEPEQLAAIDK
eukprot:jgi/Ulvmu1/9132/UM005_0230.1